MGKITLPAGTNLRQIEYVQDVTLGLMAEHGLHGWSFQWNAHRTIAGQCRRRDTTILLSARLMSLWPVPDCRNTALHEIAHATTLPGHGNDWAARCLELGIRPAPCWDPEQLPTAYKWEAACPNGHIRHRNRLTRAVQLESCGTCSDRYDPQFLFTWKETGR